MKLDSLQSLRFIFALMIFLSHYNITGNLGDLGGVGVSYFMILSGFVMSIGYHDKVTESDFNYKNFMLKRLSRLWPLHMLCLLFVVALRIFVAHDHFSSGVILSLTLNVLMLQSWVPYMPAYFSFNGVSWFLTLMVFFYAIYPFMVRKIKSLKGEWIAMVSFGIVFLYIALFGLIPENWQHPLLYISPIFRLTDFMLGMALYSAYKFISVELSDKLEVLSFTRKSAIEVGVVLLLAIMVAMDLCGFVNKGIFMASYFWLPMSSIILIFTLFNKSGGGNFKVIKQ